MPANDRQVGGTHYQTGVVQHWDFVLMHNIPYMEAQIIKYVMRWRKKGGIDDLRKAVHFIEKLMEHEMAQAPSRAQLCLKKGYATSKTDEAIVSEADQIRAELQRREQEREDPLNSPETGNGPGNGYTNPDEEATCRCNAEIKKRSKTWYCPMHGNMRIEGEESNASQTT